MGTTTLLEENPVCSSSASCFSEKATFSSSLFLLDYLLSTVYKCVCQQYSDRMYNNLMELVTSYLRRVAEELQVCLVLLVMVDWSGNTTELFIICFYQHNPFNYP